MCINTEFWSNTVFLCKQSLEGSNNHLYWQLLTCKANSNLLQCTMMIPQIFRVASEQTFF